MSRSPRPAIAAVVSFIDCINRGDIDGLRALMTEGHTLQVLDEAPLVGKAANVEAWKGYASSFPEYGIYPHRFAELDGRVAVLGHTTGSHLALPDDDERMLTVIWLAHVDQGLLDVWRILEDVPEHRNELGLNDA